MAIEMIAASKELTPVGEKTAARNFSQKSHRMAPHSRGTSREGFGSKTPKVTAG